MLDAQIDLLALRDASMSGLIQALEQVLAEGRDAGCDTNALSAIIDLAADEVVRLVRNGSRKDLLGGGLALARFLAHRDGRTIKELVPGSYEKLDGFLPVLTAAASPSGKGGEGMVLRSWRGKAQQTLERLASNPDGLLPRARLRQLLNVGESYLSHMLADLERASLVGRIAIQGRRGVDVYLTAEGRAMAAQPDGPGKVRRRRVPVTRRVELNRRVKNSECRGGAGARFRESIGCKNQRSS